MMKSLGYTEGTYAWQDKAYKLVTRTRTSRSSRSRTRRTIREHKYKESCFYGGLSFERTVQNTQLTYTFYLVLIAFLLSLTLLQYLK